MSDETEKQETKKTPAELLHVMQDRFLKDAAEKHARELVTAWENLWNVLSMGVVDGRKALALLNKKSAEGYKVDSSDILKIMDDYEKSKIIEAKTRDLFEKLRGISAMALASGIPNEELPWYNPEYHP